MTKTTKLLFTDSKDAVRWYTDRAFLMGVTRRQIATTMAVGENYVSMLRSSKNSERLPLDQIRSFAHACRLSEAQKWLLMWLRLKELDGQKSVIDKALIRDFAMAVRRLPAKV